MTLVALAYDVYTLRHAMLLRPGSDREATRERAGYSVEWLTNTTHKLPEFIARSPTGPEIAVEAKSRVRPGVLGRSGKAPDESELKADLARLLRDALAKEAEGRPLVVFLDLNLPPGSQPIESTFQGWIVRLHDEVLASAPVPRATPRPNGSSPVGWS